MTEWQGNAAPGARPQPEDEATRRARHEVLATLLGAYADGELPPETMAQVEAHLLGCDRCRREVVVQQALADRLAVLAAPTPAPDLLARLRQVTAEPPTPAPIERPRDARHRVARWLGALALASIGGWYAMSTRASQDLESALAGPAPVEARTLPPLLESIVREYRDASRRDLPGRARDLDAVRSAVGVPITPLQRPDLRLVGAWTSEVDGELAAVLAYRWQDRLVLQYTVPDAALFRAADVRRAIADGRALAAQSGPSGVLAWPEAQGGSVIVSDVPWAALRALQPPMRAVRPAGR